MNFAQLVSQIISTITDQQPVNQENPDDRFTKLIRLLDQMKAAKNPDSYESLLATLNSLHREIMHNGVNSPRASALIDTILSNIPKRFQLFDLVSGAKTKGSRIEIVMAGLNVGKTFIERMTSAPCVSATELGEAVIDNEAGTLTYFTKDSEIAFVIKDFTPGCIRVKTAGVKKQ